MVVVARGKGTDRNKFYLHEVVLQKNLQEESIKTDTKADSHQGDIAKLLKEIVTAKKNGEKATEQRDKEYIDAVLAGDTEKVDAMIREEAERKGYNLRNDYQGSLAFNGAAPSKNGYFETREERKEAFENGEFGDTFSLGDFVKAGIDANDLEWQLANPMRASGGSKPKLESIRNINNAIKSKTGEIKMYRSVPADVKEGEFRNGDWVTPSRAYAEQHIELQDWKGGRIIEQEVPVDDIWWDGNDINEWGYDDGKEYAYKNTKNNRKLLEPTYDDNGNLIPLSQRFNQGKNDIRFSIGGARESLRNDLENKGISINNKELLDKYGLSNLTLAKSGDHVTLSKIVAAEQGKGNGTRFMEDLARLADANGWTLALTPDTSFGGTSVSRLKNFYKKFGFKDNKGRNTDFETRESMVRKPEKGKAGAAAKEAYREWKANEVDKKESSFGERSGVVSGNSSSEGLFRAGSEHLSRNAYPQRESDAKIQENTKYHYVRRKKSYDKGKKLLDYSKKRGKSLYSRHLLATMFYRSICHLHKSSSLSRPIWLQARKQGIHT